MTKEKITNPPPSTDPAKKNVDEQQNPTPVEKSENPQSPVTTNTSEPTDAAKTKIQLNIPVAIIIAGALIAGSIFLSNVYKARLSSAQPSKVAGQQIGQQALNQSDYAKKVSPIKSSDHILGSAEAKIKIIEFSDFDCPYCDKVQPILNQLVKDYGPDKIAWIYRHYPIPQLHPTAEKKAEASECVAEIAGNAAFWKFANSLFENQTTAKTDEQLTNLAQKAGTNRGEFTSCLANGKYANKVATDTQDALTSGAQGTPYMIIIAKGNFIPLEGAAPLEYFKAQIDPLMK